MIPVETGRPACYFCISDSQSTDPCNCEEFCGRRWCPHNYPIDEWVSPPVPVFVPEVRVVPRVILPRVQIMVDMHVVPCGMMEL